MEQHPLYQDQLALEEQMRSLGTERYFKQVNEAKEDGNESKTMPAKRLMGHAHLRMVQALTTFLDEARSGKAGRRSEAFSTLKDIDVDLVAHLTVRAVIDRLSSRHTLTSTAMACAQLIEDELHYRAFKEQKFYTFKKTLAKAKQSPSDAYKRRHMRASARKVETKFVDWSQKKRALVGLKLVELFIDSTGSPACTLRPRAVKPRRPSRPPKRPSRGWRKSTSVRRSCPRCTCPRSSRRRSGRRRPDGGYYSGRVRRLTLVKTPNKHYLDGLSKIDMPTSTPRSTASRRRRGRSTPRCSTPWTEMYDRGYSFGAIPEPQSTPLPAKPFWLAKEIKYEDMTDEQQKEFMRWKGETKATHEANARSTAKRIQFIRMKWVADMFKDRAAIYFPHQLDFRGRVYPVTLYLHPQGNDSCRGLLTSARRWQIGSKEA
jgi:DNA-directed RNA polymerase